MFGIDAPTIGSVPVVRGKWGTIVAPASRVAAFVRSTGIQSDDDPYLATNLVQTVAAGLARCRAGMGDVVFVLPGHTEAVGTTMFSGCPAGSRLVGLGEPDQDDAPTLTWDAAASNIALASKNVTLCNLRLVANADNITKAITVTAANIKICGCYFDLGSAAAKDMTLAVSVEAGANGLTVNDCSFIATAGVVQAINISALNANTRIIRNRFIGLTTNAATGIIAISAATTNYVTNLLIEGNKIASRTASSTAAITFTDIAHTGEVIENFISTKADAATPAAGGIVLAGTTNILVNFFQNYHSDGVKGSSGILAPAVTS